MAGCDKQSMQSGVTVSSGSPLRNRILVIRHGEVSSFTLHRQPLLYLVKSRMAKNYHGLSTVESSPLLSRFMLCCVSQSESNVQNILVSNPEVGVPLYGLTEKGKMQAREVKIVD